MTDSTGVFQHAIFSVPNFSEGYCTDDNARAFILAVLIGELGGDTELERSLASTSAAFLHHAFDPASGRFHNHMSFDRRWLDEQGSEDSHGRAVWALGVGVGRSELRSFQMMAGQLFARALPALTEFSSPRAWAFGLLGIHEYLRRLGGDSQVNQVREVLMTRLVELYHRHQHADWQWFEDELSYDNARLSHALIVSGRATGRQDVLERRPGRHCSGYSPSKPQRGVTCGRLAATVSITVADRGLTSISSPSRLRPRWLPAWKPTGRLRTCSGTNMRNVPSTGSSGPMISVSNFTCPRQAAAAMDCTWTA